ncbi:MAG: protein kinase, partial [Vicinamibacteria bacterium]|nr:protein kinase [Vicinamibacteria bacterium]
REAQILATLNHPNIAAIYGIEEADGVLALVLELIDGEDLAARLRRGPIPPREAVVIARQIGLGLEEAHEKGIVHRDLKPGNLKLTPQGGVKILDFGLARIYDAPPPLADTDPDGAPSATTLASPMTEGGIIHGTPAYMSPEQARGAALDQRSDIWAFGCILYEMLTARRAFAGNTTSDIIAKILEREPDWTALPAGMPPGLEHELRRCLEKNPKRRLRHIADARFDEHPTALSDGAAGASSRGPASRLPTWALIGAAFIAGGALAWLRRSGGAPIAAAPIARLTLTIPADQTLEIVAGARPLAIAPDGRRVAYAALKNGSTGLYVRAVDAFEPVALEGTEGAGFPFFSPDGQSIAFFADGMLKRVAISGGAPVPICEAPGERPGGRGRGGTWGPDGTIVFDPGDSGLMRVAAAGGTPTLLTGRDKAMDARNYWWPEFLPDGRGLLATVNGLETPGDYIALRSMETGEWRVLGPGDQPRYLSSGYLVYHAPHLKEGELQAVRFDAAGGTLQGQPFSVLDGVFRAAGSGGIYFDLSRAGTLVFAPGGLAHTIVRVDRKGRRTPLSEDRRGFRFPRLSPDGRQVAVTIDPRPSQIWVYDIERRSRLSLVNTGHSIGSVWTKDGRRIAYSKTGGTMWIAADGSGVAQQLSAFPYPSDFTRDGRLLVDEGTATHGLDLRIVTPGGPSGTLLATPANESGARLSPDERWMAYVSDESGRGEVYVRRFPSPSEGKWIVSTSGGHSPAWSPDGREIFYMTGTTLMAASVAVRGTSLVVGTPLALFSGPFDTTQDKSFDVFPDGSGFVMVEVDPDTRPTRLNVVLNWIEELKKKAAEP